MLQEKQKTIATRIGKAISTRQRDGCDKDRQTDIDQANRQGEEDHEELNRQGEEYCDEEKEKTTTKGRSTVILKR